MRRCRPHLFALVFLLVAGPLAVLAAGGPGRAAALEGLPPPGSSGWDISYPQCGGAYPVGGTFAVIGVNNGRPFTANPCLASEFAWASGTIGHAELYINTSNPAPSSSFYWAASGARDPALCIDNTSTTDPGCAYDYGWHAAEYSLALARSALGPAADTVRWWLDVETANSWNGDGYSNAAAIQGQLDYLRTHGIARVGIYSTGYQWGLITGGYTLAAEQAYRAHWSPYFAPAIALAEAPNWVAGAITVRGAAENCLVSFTGAYTELAQYFRGPFDADLICGGVTAGRAAGKARPAHRPPPAPAAPAPPGLSPKPPR